MKRVSLVAAATLTMMACSVTFALADDAAKAAVPAKATEATAAVPAKVSEAKAAVPARAAEVKAAVPAKAAAPSTDKAIAAIDAQIAAHKPNKSQAGWKTHLTIPTVVQFDPAKKYFVRMVTSEGPILIRMMPDIAPMHVTNFLYLARMGFYDGIIFHRVIPGFMAQSGDPLGNGQGGPATSSRASSAPKRGTTGRACCPWRIPASPAPTAASSS